MDRIQPGSRDGANPNTNDHEYQSAGNDNNKMQPSGCEPIEKRLWNPHGLVICRSCHESRWQQSFFGHSHTGLEISALLCRNCFDLAVVRHTRYYALNFIMAAYYVAIRNVAGDAEYKSWKPNHSFKTQASLPTFDRLQPRLPKGFRKGKLA